MADAERFSERVALVTCASSAIGAAIGAVKGCAWGPHEQGRAAIESSTESVTVHRDAPVG